MGEPVDLNNPTKRGQEYLAKGGIRVMPDRAGYATSVGQTLLHFQLLENAVKEYLIFHETKGKSHKEIEAERPRLESDFDLTFGPLAGLYKKATPNVAVADRVAALVRPRNDLAHRSFKFIYSRKVPREEYFAENIRLLNLNRTIIEAWEGVLSEVADLMVDVVRKLPNEHVANMFLEFDRAEIHRFLLAQLMDPND